MTSGAVQAPLVESVGDELRALLSPITPQRFVHEYWAKKPLFVKGFRDKYKGFFDGETFIRALSLPGPAPEDFLRASFDKKTATRSPKGKDEWASVAFRASLEQAVPLFNAGATLCVTQMETRVPRLAPFLAAIKRQLGYPGKVSFNAYLSPPEAGFNWHFDGRIASTLQIEGSKRWRFSNRAAVPWPHANGALRADGTGQYTDSKENGEEWKRIAPFDEKDTTEVLLEPGDLLILPAGVWHDACGGATGSLALNLSFTAVSFTLLMQNLLDDLMAPNPHWRSPSPLLPLSAGMVGEVEPEGVAEIAAQLASAADALRSLAGDSAAVIRLWSSFVQNPNPGLRAPPPPPLVTLPVQPAQRLRVRSDGNVYPVLADGGTRLFVAVGTSGGVEVSGEAVRFVQRMLAEKEFVAGDCLRWSDDRTPFVWSDVETMLTKLKRDGLIEDAQSTR
jgi:ribosomal protein L16 Arg81 hydroxylase